jgi:REP element-mobilizing transposase RayT
MIKDRPPRFDEIFQAYDTPLFFVTICTIHRRKIADLETVHRAFQKYIARAFSDFGVAVGRYLIMPDHMHFFVRGSDDFELVKWINGLKRAMSLAVGATKERPPVATGIFRPPLV